MRDTPQHVLILARIILLRIAGNNMLYWRGVVIGEAR